MTVKRNIKPEVIADAMAEIAKNPEYTPITALKASGYSRKDAELLDRRIKKEYPVVLEAVKPITREALEKRISRRLEIIDTFFTEEKLIQKLEKANLRDITIMEGTMMDKLLILRGQPSMIIGHLERGKLNELVPALLEEIKRRGLKQITETKAELEIGQDGSSGDQQYSGCGESSGEESIKDTPSTETGT